mmetsp:Transcript_41979/g.118802  ORF Transcript_41979/g.118802 Transcript_41979/m.118802 type:complete len:211 (-) Transcript_41979:240-872(-)
MSPVFSDGFSAGRFPRALYMLRGKFPTRRMGWAPSTSSVCSVKGGLLPVMVPPPCSPTLRSPTRLPWMCPISWHSVVGAALPHTRRSSAQRACNDVANAADADTGTRYLGSNGFSPWRPERAGPSRVGVQHARRPSPGAAGRVVRHGSCEGTARPRGLRNSASKRSVSRYSRRMGTTGDGAVPGMSETSMVSRPLPQTSGGGCASEDAIR